MSDLYDWTALMTFCGGATRVKVGRGAAGAREGEETDDCEWEWEWWDLSELRDLRRAFMVVGGWNVQPSVSKSRDIPVPSFPLMFPAHIQTRPESARRSRVGAIAMVFTSDACRFRFTAGLLEEDFRRNP